MTKLSDLIEPQTKCFALNALTKLYDRFLSSNSQQPQILDHIQTILKKFDNSSDYELQKRACEYLSIFSPENQATVDINQLISKLFDRMPPIDHPYLKGKTILDKELEMNAEEEEGEDISAEIAEKRVGIHHRTKEEANEEEEIQKQEEAETSKPKPAGYGDLLTFLNDKSPNNEQMATPVSPMNFQEPQAIQEKPQIPAQVPQKSLIDLDQIFDVNAPMQKAKSSVISREIFSKGGFSVDFEISRLPNLENNGIPNIYDITAKFTNRTMNQFSDFDFLLAVPRHLKMKLYKPSSSVIPALSQKQVSQKIEIENTLFKEKPVVLKFKAEFKKLDENKQEIKIEESEKVDLTDLEQ